MKPLPAHLRAIALALVGYTGWVCGDTCLKLAGELNVPKSEVMAIAGLSGMLVILGLTALRGEIHRLRPRKPRALLVLGILFSASYGAWLVALKTLSLANLYVVIFMAPMVVAILAVIFFARTFERADSGGDPFRICRSRHCRRSGPSYA